MSEETVVSKCKERKFRENKRKIH